MSDILKAFNDHFEEFVKDVEKVFPNDPDLKKAKTGLSLIRMSNPKIIINTYKEYLVIPYRKQIENEDISFFIEKDYSNDLTDANTILLKIEQLRNPVRNMDKSNQKKVMQYLKNLMKLCDLYN